MLKHVITLFGVSCHNGIQPLDGLLGFLHKNVNNKLIKKQNISLEKAKKKQNKKRIKP